MTVRARLVAALGVVLAAGVPTLPAAHASTAVVRPAASAAPVAQQVSVRSEPDGTPVRLDVSVYPQTTGRHPVVLLAHGFGGSKDSVAVQAVELQERGYVVVTWSARGHGASGGRIHLDDPQFEVADARAMLDLAAARPDVELDASGDPRAGVMGASYGGALALLLAGADPRVDGVVAAITWNDLAEAFFPQSALTRPPTTAAGRAPTAEPGPFKQVWASNFFLGARRGSGAAASECGRFDPTICRLFVQASETGTPSPQLLALLRAHSPRATMPQVKAPTFLVQGQADSLFGLDQADATASALDASGTPYAVRWTDGGHDAPSSRVREETDASYAWLDHWVRDKAPHESALPTVAFTYSTPAARRGQASQLFTLPHYPGLGGSALSTTTLPLRTTTGVLSHPPGGQPASLIAVPGLAALGVTLSTYQIAALPGQSTALDTEPVATGTTAVGSPTLRLTVTSDQPTVTLFASLWRVSGGQATLPHALVSPLRVTVTPGRPTPVTLSLPAATYPMPAGSQWRVLLTATESTFSNDRTPATVRVRADGGLVVPVAAAAPAAGSGTGIDTETRVAASALAVLLLVALGGWLVGRRRRAHAAPRPDLADVPLVVDGLVKTYADGHRAVDDVSWRAERGQVVGLLGPNGAGKTTTMRMVMGLISSDAGSVHVLGQPVTAGSDVLGRVGALIEGPGFLPHLTGRQNLEAYWRATGRPSEDAHLDEALDVAALGGAVDRPVKSYSHGMKQRLGIAQAMLGLPELLVLDEPTNGLDPPQIAAMRPILRRYAETGRTVVVSSHLLAEVEMTCTHVVVMHAGRVVTQGPVADLVDSQDTTLVDVEEGVERHRLHDLAAALAAAPGVSEVRVDTPTRLVVVADLDRAAVVRAAVESGVPVVGVSSRRHLEEVFLGVISAAASSNGTGPGDQSVSLVDRLRQVRAR
ncbi:alpha/beta fold hydrolase [Intrasporangium sp. YIM S08009]|uniref:alpha/beta fold hydrolase n=1 Tax=Intrasporangium zincisolvens TaxID=3080018 RepID=UPI002B0605BE|nr:alpha/beta fold hydrolase [Intrasporangium sp. YIM S08009]